jgi:hypothetical protein
MIFNTYRKHLGNLQIDNIDSNMWITQKRWTGLRLIQLCKLLLQVSINTPLITNLVSLLTENADWWRGGASRDLYILINQVDSKLHSTKLLHGCKTPGLGHYPWLHEDGNLYTKKLVLLLLSSYRGKGRSPSHPSHFIFVYVLLQMDGNGNSLWLISTTYMYM